MLRASSKDEAGPPGSRIRKEPVFSLFDLLRRICYKFCILPLVSGISYEVIRFTGRQRDWRTGAIPELAGLLMQKFTTREPKDDQIEVAVEAIRKVT
jgi:uncharacterized protein YqhQ